MAAILVFLLFITCGALKAAIHEDDIEKKMDEVLATMETMKLENQHVVNTLEARFQHMQSKLEQPQQTLDTTISEFTYIYKSYYLMHIGT